jgi:SM-20-related protein
MAGEIEVFDDVVPLHLVQTLDQVVRMPIWKYGVKSSKDDPLAFWVAPFADNEVALTSMPEISALWECVKRKLKVPMLISAAYANGQTAGLPGQIHTDDPAPGYKTAVFYANSQWEADWHGETMFYTPDRSDVIRAVLPRPGRFVIFDSNIPHAARDPSRLCAVLRVTITFKLRPIGAPASSRG